MKLTKKRKLKTNGHLNLPNPLFWQILNKGRYANLVIEGWETQHIRDIAYRQIVGYRKSQGIDWPR